MSSGTEISSWLDGDRTSGRRSANDLLRLYPEMGIPNFQRGLVWETPSVSSLLESLYFNTPCGSVILWAADEPLAHGIPLGPDAPRFLIVDGQQRIRSLSGVFNDAQDSSDVEANEEQSEGNDSDQADGRADAIWCLNLGQVPELKDKFRGGKRYQLFRRATDPRRLPPTSSNKKVTGAVLQDRDALLPLNWFLAHEEDSLRAMIEDSEHRRIAGAVEAVLALPAVDSRLRELRTRRLFDVAILADGHTHRDVIAIYNRINSSGKKVEAEHHEIIDGEHVVTPSPNVRHQRLVRRLLVEIELYLKANPRAGEVFSAPLDVVQVFRPTLEGRLARVVELTAERPAAANGGPCAPSSGTATRASPQG